MPLITGFYANISLIILVLIEQVSFSGIIFGFNSLHLPYKYIKVFYHLCSNKFTNTSENDIDVMNITSENDTDVMKILSCPAQTNMYSTAFIVWTVVVNLVAFPVGSFFDRYGIRVTKMCGAVLFLAGCICFALASERHPYFLFPGGILCAVSCQFLMICNLQVSQVFPRYQSIIISLCCGAFDSSSVIFEFIRLTFMKAGISLMASFLCLGFAGFSLQILTAGFLLPYHTSSIGKLAVFNEKSKLTSHNNNINGDDTYVKTNEKNSLVDLTEKELDNIKFKTEDEENELLENEETLLKSDNELEKRYPSLKSCVFSRFFFFHVLFFAFILLRFTFFLTSLDQLLLEHFGKDNYGHIISKLSYFLFSGILVAPLTGLLIDFLRAKFAVSNNIDPQNAYWLSLRPLVAAISICCIASLAMSFVVFMSNEMAIYAAYVFLVITRAFLFSCQSASLLMAFPLKHFGTCFGIAFFCAGLFSTIQYALLVLASVNLLATNIILVILCLLSLLHPIQIFIGNKLSCRRSDELKNSVKNPDS